MSSRTSVGSARHNRTVLTVDEDALDEVFARDAFMPTFDDDERVVSSVEDMEAVLGVSVVPDDADDGGASGEATTTPETDTASAETVDGVDTSSASHEPGADAPGAGAATSGTTSNEAEIDMADGTETDTGGPDSPEAFDDEPPTDTGEHEYSAVRRIRSLAGRADGILDSDDEGAEQPGLPGGDNGTTDTEADDEALPVPAPQSRFHSLVDQVKSIFR